MNTTISNAGTWLRSSPVISSEPSPTRPRNDGEVRDHYNEAVTEELQKFFVKAAHFHDNQQCFGEDIAREAFATRDALKRAHQGETSWHGQIGIGLRNLWKYGCWNPTFEVLSRGKNPEEVAYSAFKTDGSDLGLVGNGFGDVIATWKAIHDLTLIYPEAITPEMVSTYKAQPAGAVDPAAIVSARTSVAATDEQQVKKLVDPAAGTTGAQATRAEVFSKEELLAALGHAPRRNYVYM